MVRTSARPRAISSLSLILAISAVVLAACGSTSPPATSSSPTSSTPSSSSSASSSTPGSAALSLDQARAAWAATSSSRGEYRLRLVRSCFCPQSVVDSTVSGGKVTDKQASFGQDQPRKSPPAEVDPALLAGYPLTVEALHQVIADASDAAELSVTYDRRGVPLRIQVDPIAAAADDEFGYAVEFSSRVEPWAPATGNGPWVRRITLPAGSHFPTDFPQPGQGAAQTFLTADASGAGVYLGFWGSSSCPIVPRSLVFRPEPAEAPGHRLITADISADGTTAPGVACTADYGPTIYSARLADGSGPAPDLSPAASGGDVPTLQLVVELIRGTSQEPDVISFVIDAGNWPN